MGSLKSWVVDYSVKYIDGKVEERTNQVLGLSIEGALASAMKDTIDPLKHQPDVSDAVIWNIGILADLEDDPNYVF